MKIATIVPSNSTIIHSGYREWSHPDLVKHLKMSGEVEALNSYQRQIDALPKWMSSDRLPIAFSVHGNEGLITFLFMSDC